MKCPMCGRKMRSMKRFPGHKRCISGGYHAPRKSLAEVQTSLAEKDRDGTFDHIVELQKALIG